MLIKHFHIANLQHLLHTLEQSNLANDTPETLDILMRITISTAKRALALHDLQPHQKPKEPAPNAP